MEQFEDLMVRILLLAASVSFVSMTRLIKNRFPSPVFGLNVDSEVYICGCVTFRCDIHLC